MTNEAQSGPYLLNGDGETVLSTTPATCGTCGAEGLRGDWPDEGGIVSGECDPCALASRVAANKASRLFVERWDEAYGWRTFEQQGNVLREVARP